MGLSVVMPVAVRNRRRPTVTGDNGVGSRPRGDLMTTEQGATWQECNRSSGRSPYCANSLSAPPGVTDIAERVHLPKSTVSRLLSALEAEGAVAQRDTGGDYELGAGLAALADAAEQRRQHGRRRATVPARIERARRRGGRLRRAVGSQRLLGRQRRTECDAAVQVQDRTGFYAPMHSVPAGSGAAGTSAARRDRQLSRAAARTRQRSHDHRRRRAAASARRDRYRRRRLVARRSR